MEMSVRLSEAAEGFHRRLDDHKVKLLIGIDRQISATMAEAAAI
ncbi:MAG: hypothetical protein Q7R40_11755 [Phaeospirillum sp.]|nr:hypothetical protein [Phaeospirillum sp.]